MEVAGLVISIAGLASLATTCVDLIRRSESFLRPDKERRPLLLKLDGHRIRLEDWITDTGVLDEHGARDELHRPAVARLVHATLTELNLLHSRMVEPEQASQVYVLTKYR